MTTLYPVTNENERLPLILGFQRISENTARETRFMDYGKGIYGHL